MVNRSDPGAWHAMLVESAWFVVQYLCWFAPLIVAAVLFVVYQLWRFSRQAGWATTRRYLGSSSPLIGLVHGFAWTAAGGLALSMIYWQIGLALTYGAASVALVHWYRTDLEIMFWSRWRQELDHGEQG